MLMCYRKRTDHVTLLQKIFPVEKSFPLILRINSFEGWATDNISACCLWSLVLALLFPIEGLERNCKVKRKTNFSH
jgi:hypothetical protein